MYDRRTVQAVLGDRALRQQAQQKHVALLYDGDGSGRQVRRIERHGDKYHLLFVGGGDVWVAGDENLTVVPMPVIA